MGVARSVPGFVPAGGHRNLHPAPAPGDADLPGNQGQGQMTRNPWKEAFLSSNIKYILIATVVLIGQGVVWYSGQFWALYFLQQVSKVDSLSSAYIVGAALLIA